MVRGGSWNNNQRNARCAYRNRNNPNNRNTNNGLRLVVSTLLVGCVPAGTVVWLRATARGSTTEAEKWRSRFPAALAVATRTSRAHTNGPAPWGAVQASLEQGHPGPNLMFAEQTLRVSMSEPQPQRWHC